MRQVRSVAARLEPVGRGLLVNVLPREAVEDRGPNIILAGEPQSDLRETFLYVPPGIGTRRVVYGPTYACGGVQGCSNFEARAPPRLGRPSIALWFSSLPPARERCSSLSGEGGPKSLGVPGLLLELVLDLRPASKPAAQVPTERSQSKKFTMTFRF